MKIYKFDDFKLEYITDIDTIIPNCHFLDALIFLDVNRYAAIPDVLRISDTVKHNQSIINHIHRTHSLAHICSSIAKHLANTVTISIIDSKVTMRRSYYSYSPSDLYPAPVALSSILQSTTNPFVGFVPDLLNRLGVFDCLPKEKRTASLETVLRELQKWLLSIYYIEEC